jgi:enoyl-CoA hydratase
MKFKNLIIDEQDSICTITIDRPKKLNALNIETIKELHDAFKQADEDKNIRAIIITGSGEKAFVAGADISEFADFSVAQGEKLASQGQALLFDFVAHLATPVIAAVNGFALGGGLELAMAAHIRIASNNSKMGLPEVSLGVIPGYGGTQRLPQLVGKGIAMEMILTAGMIDANQALQYGLINHLTSEEDLIPAAEKIALKISRNSPLAVSAAIEAVNAGYEDGENGFSEEVSLFGRSFGTADFQEGTKAFFDKRKPEFPGK